MNLDALTWVAVVGVVLLSGWIGMRMLRQRLENQRYQEELADLEFQQSVLGGVVTVPSEDDSRFLQSSAAALRASSDLAPAVAQSDSLPIPTPVFSEAGPMAADVLAAGVMNQLGAMGLVRGVDGYMPLHNNPKGAALLRLRSGKTALLVPQMESEGYLRANARRADLIIMAGADGKAVVVMPLEQYLAENISPG